jgi:hypothetical protein
VLDALLTWVHATYASVLMGERGLASGKTVGSYSPVVTVTHGRFFGTAKQYVYTLHQEVG